MTWTDASITDALVRQIFQRSVVVVPHTHWPGNECDLLAVEPKLRLVEVEVKISRADLRADIDKDKWRLTSRELRQREHGKGARKRVRVLEWPMLAWPRRVWKHYYALPASIWSPDLLASIPEESGILTLTGSQPRPSIRVVRRARPNRDASRISAEEVLDLARLVSLRYWDQRQAKGIK